MPTLSSGQYNTVGEAFVAFVNDIIPFILDPTPANFFTTISKPAPTAAGGLLATVKQGDIKSAGLYSVASWVVNTQFPQIGEVLRSSGMSDPISLLFGDGPNDATVIVPTIFVAHDQLVNEAALLNPYLLLRSIQFRCPSVVNGLTAVYNKLTSWAHASDSGSSALVVQNQNGLTSPSKRLAPAGPSFSRNQAGQPVINVTITIPQYQDASIDRGQAIFTTQTRTYTNPNGVP